MPYGRVQVPDAGIQALIDSSIRNIWQAREIKKGLPAFQVGPTCYRGLWIVDGAFLLEAAAMLGAGDQARNGVAYELTHQKPDGRIEVMQNYWKENGIVLWTCVRHAQLTQDKAWLESVWPKLERIAQFIKLLRKKTLENNSPLDDGLQPPGFPDGGIGGVQYEYTNIYWNLLGLRAFVQAAQLAGQDGRGRRLAEGIRRFPGHVPQGRRTRHEDRPARQPLPADPAWNGQDLPQRGQWGFCHGVYPGPAFRQGRSAGRPATWPCSKPPSARAWSMAPAGTRPASGTISPRSTATPGSGRATASKAAQVLYAYANHAAPVLDWREEQSLRGEPYKKVGDMPHNWASAEFIRLAVHLLELDRGDELHLLEGMPAQWLGPGMTTRLKGVATPFGPLHLTVQVSKDGRTATLDVQPLAANCKSVVVHRPDGGTCANCTATGRHDDPCHVARNEVVSISARRWCRERPAEDFAVLTGWLPLVTL